jgi:hypothetical protein
LHADAQQQTTLLQRELDIDRDLKVQAEGVSTGLAAEIGQHQEEIWGLESEVSR